MWVWINTYIYLCNRPPSTLLDIVQLHKAKPTIQSYTTVNNQVQQLGPRHLSLDYYILCSFGFTLFRFEMRLKHIWPNFFIHEFNHFRASMLTLHYSQTYLTSFRVSCFVTLQVSQYNTQLRSDAIIFLPVNNTKITVLN